MPKRSGPAYVVTTTRKYKGRTYHSHLLRRSYRENGRVKNETLGNLSHLPDAVLDLVRRSLKGEVFVSAQEAFETVASPACGHVNAVRSAMQGLGLERLVHSRPCRERDLVLAMIAARVLCPDTKLATTRQWHQSTLAKDFGVVDASADDLYAAMDWLLARQGRIQKKLADRHLPEGGLVLYDLSSSYLEGTHCPLAKRGHNRDGKKGKLQVNYGLLTDPRGCPVAVSVHEGNTADPVTLLPEVDRLRKDFGLAEFVMVGDRGMLSNKAIGALREMAGVSWITALKSVSIRSLVEKECLQLSLFDERNLFELTHPDYPGERLIACRNPALASHRAAKREALLTATETRLEKIRERVSRGRLTGADAIGLAVGKVINTHKVAKHFELTINEGRFAWSRNASKIAAEAALDGIYMLRTSVKQMSAEDCVRNYKSLANVERAFRSLKTIDLKVRPIHHRLADRVRAHIFLCMLAEYVAWHLREAWRPLLFADEDQAAKRTRDPVAPAHRSAAAVHKAQTQTTRDGLPVHSFQTLLAELAGIVRSVCRAPGTRDHATTFTMTTTPNPVQRKALELAAAIRV